MLRAGFEKAPQKIFPLPTYHALCLIHAKFEYNFLFLDEIYSTFYVPRFMRGIQKEALV